MAKYYVNHNCGHTQMHELFGKELERERRIEWLKTTECKDCWTASQIQARKSEPVTAEVIYNQWSDGCWLAVTTGDTYAIKDALKAAGCRWQEYHSNADVFGARAPRKAWMIKIDPDNAEETAAIVQRLHDAGVTAIKDTTNPIARAIAAKLAGK